MMDHRMSSLSKISAIALVAVISACGGSRQQANAPLRQSSEAYGSTMSQPPQTDQDTTDAPHANTSNSTPGAAESATSPGDQGPPNGSNAMTSSTSQTGVDMADLRDPEIAAVMRVIHQSEVQEAQLAQSKTGSDEVKRFARDAIATRSERLRREDSLFSRLQLTPSENAVSSQFSVESQGQLAALQTAHGLDFDRDYIDAEIRSHQHALELIHRLLLQAQDSGLKVELGATRQAILHELAWANTLRLNLNSPPSDTSESV
jgi:putative membrane protein